MTLLGELYANGFGVARDDAKAAEWYRLAADRGDRDAMFALAMFRIGGRGGPANREEAAKLLAAAAKLGHAPAAYDLGMLYLEGQQFPQDFKRAAEMFRIAARPAVRKRNTRSRRSTRKAGACQRTGRAARLLGAAALADNTDAQVEYAIALFNGTGVAKDEARGRGASEEGRATRAAPIAQNRLARILVGRPRRCRPIRSQAIKWHLISKAGGASDLNLDEFMQQAIARNARRRRKGGRSLDRRRSKAAHATPRS